MASIELGRLGPPAQLPGPAPPPANLPAPLAKPAPPAPPAPLPKPAPPPANLPAQLPKPAPAPPAQLPGPAASALPAAPAVRAAGGAGGGPQELELGGIGGVANVNVPRASVKPSAVPAFSARAIAALEARASALAHRSTLNSADLAKWVRRAESMRDTLFRQIPDPYLPVTLANRRSVDEEDDVPLTEEQMRKRVEAGMDLCYKLIGEGAVLFDRPSLYGQNTILHVACNRYGIGLPSEHYYKKFLEDLALTIILCPDMERYYLNVEDDSRSLGGLTPLMHASKNGMLAVVTMLVSKLPKNGHGIDKGIGTALYYACRYSQPEAAMILIEAGADVCYGDKEFNTVPLAACYIQTGRAKGSIKPGMEGVATAIQIRGGTKGESKCVVAGGGRKNRRNHHKSRKNRKQKQRATTRRQK